MKNHLIFPMMGLVAMMEHYYHSLSCHIGDYMIIFLSEQTV